MKLKESIEKVLLDVLYCGVRHDLSKRLPEVRPIEESFLPRIEKVFAEVEAFEKATKILAQVFDIEDSAMQFIYEEVNCLKKSYNPDAYKRGLEEFKKKTEGSSKINT